MEVIDYINSYFTLSYVRSITKSLHDNDDIGIEFHTFSEKISSTSANYDVLTFYITFILVIGQILRGAITGDAERVILSETPELLDLMNLCEGIKIYRYRHNFER